MTSAAKPKRLTVEERKTARWSRVIPSAVKPSRSRELLHALNSTSQSARTSWLFFVSFMAYLFVAVASVTHTDLLLDSPVKLPLLQIEIPLGSFFLVTPLLLILTHFGVLLHHAILRSKATAFNDSLVGDESGDPRSHNIRLEVSSYFFSQNEAGPPKGILLVYLLNAMTFLTLNALPLLLLLYFQITFLPVHNSTATWLHRAYLGLDILILLAIGFSSVIRWKWGAIWSGSNLKMPTLSVAFFAITSAFSLCIATLPSGTAGWPDLDMAMTSIWPTSMPFNKDFRRCNPTSDRCAFGLTAFIFEQPVDYVSSRRPGFSRSLVVTEKTVGGSPKASLRGRDLRYATFDRSHFQGADFTAADLTGASLKRADLKDAIFGCAVRGKKLYEYSTEAGERRVTWIDDETCPSLVRANLSEAILSDGAINKAILRNANLSRVNMQGFDLRRVDLSNVELIRADLSGANASFAIFDGAQLNSLIARGASFHGARLLGADLSGAYLDVTDLSSADFSGSNLASASLRGSFLQHTLLFGANLSRIKIWGATPPSPKAFNLSAVYELDLSKPEMVELNDLKKIVDELDNVVIDEYSYIPRLPSGFLEGSDWENSAERASWAALTTKLDSGMYAKRELGRYLAKLSCKKPQVMKGILNTHLLSYGWSDIYPDQAEVTLPDGVEVKDLVEADTIIPSKIESATIQYGDDLQLLSGFVAAIEEFKCESTLGEDKLKILREVMVRSRERIPEIELKVSVFEGQFPAEAARGEDAALRSQ